MTDNDSKEYRRLFHQLREALSDQTDQAIADRIVLRDAVCTYVAAEQIRGTPIESVIATIKEILRKAESDAHEASDELGRKLVEWCLEFHRPLAPEAPPAPVGPLS
jgi:hypothetical protein